MDAYAEGEEEEGVGGEGGGGGGKEGGLCEVLVRIKIRMVLIPNFCYCFFFTWIDDVEEFGVLMCQ